MNKITAPSFRRKITHTGWEVKEEKSKPKEKINKFSKTLTYQTTVTEIMHVYLDCGHKHFANGLSRDITKLRSMDCFECSVNWQKENNCDWQGNVK